MMWAVSIIQVGLPRVELKDRSSVGGNMLWIITELPLSGYLMIAVAVHATDAAIHPGFQELSYQNN